MVPLQESFFGRISWWEQVDRELLVSFQSVEVKPYPADKWRLSRGQHQDFVSKDVIPFCLLFWCRVYFRAARWIRQPTTLVNSDQSVQNQNRRCSLGLFFRLSGMWGRASSTIKSLSKVIFLHLIFMARMIKLPNFHQQDILKTITSTRGIKRKRKKRKIKLHQYPTLAALSARIVICDQVYCFVMFMSVFHITE